ncbi:PDZ domain-containing protein [Agriterribacter sp.]|uniref:PDZ domain-containing protein n=1 Tax=Agriterribacter sp. TaxID=2821509 RepID=UPI002C2723F4|nr:PDZ domain-containing protein [Agriterribacter sp.]HTN05661.1 PDZ domain-containing protein [Agriterribacter sp.]
MKTACCKGTALTILAFACMLTSVSVSAQNPENKKQKQEEIIIKKMSGKDKKITIVVDGDKITVNGEPLAAFNDDDIIIRKRKILGRDDDWADRSKSLRAPRPPFPPIPPVPPQAWAFPGDDALTTTAPKAMLGVYTEKDEKGAKINQVADDSPAQKAGLMKGDIITKAGDNNITDPSSLYDAISNLKPGDEIQVQYLRDNKKKKVKITLGEREALARTFNFNTPSFNEDMVKSFKLQGPQHWQGDWNMFNSKPQLGIRIQDTEESTGVQVLDVSEASPAEKSGIKKDDIITSIDGMEIKNTDDAKKKIAELKNKSTYPITVLRNNQTVQLDIKIPKKLKATDL